MFNRKFDLWNLIALAPDAPGGGGEPAQVDAPPSPDPSPVEGGDDFGGLEFGGDDIDDVSVGEVEEPAQPSTPAGAPKTPEPKPQEAPTPPPAEAPAPSTKPAEVEQPKPPGQQEQQPNPAPSEPISAWDQFQKDKPTIVESMAKTRYAMTKEDQDLLEAEPFTALPKLAARVHVELMQDVLQSMAGMLPVAFQGFMQEHAQNAAVEDEFKQAWPQIDFAKHSADVEAFAQLYRQSNPKATKAEAIQMVGAMVIAKHGLAATPQQPATPAPATPGAPPAPPFAPARPGVAAAPPPVIVEEFAGLGMDLDE